MGLDINSDSITLIQLEKTRVGIEVARFACHPTPANAIKEGLIADPEAIGAVVMDLLSQAEIPPSGPSPVVNVAVPAQAVVIRLMPVPTGMPQEELADVVTQEATNHVPFPITDANLDWSIMPATERTDADGVRRVDVILTAIQRSIIESYWRMADSAGVRLGRVDISSLASIRSLALAGYLGSTGHLSMIVNIRHDASDINIVRSAMPLFGRSIILGVETLTEAISRSLDTHFDEALDMLPQIPLFGAPPDARSGQAGQVARTIFGDIADELVRSLDFYKSQVGEVKMDQIVLSGPGCMVPQLDQFISNKIGIRTVVCDPFRDFTYDKQLIPETMLPILAALIGTAIEPSWNPSFTVDIDLNKEGRLPLLFDERSTQAIIPEEVTTPWFKPVLLTGMAALAVLSVLWLFIIGVDMPSKQRTLASVNEQIMADKAQLERAKRTKKESDLITNKKKAIEKIITKTSEWSSILDEIRNGTPQDIKIEHIAFQGKQLVIEGSAQNFKSVSNFTLNLSNNPELASPTLKSATRNENNPDLIDFSVLATMNSARAEAKAPDAVPARNIHTSFTVPEAQVCRSL